MKLTWTKERLAICALLVALATGTAWAANPDKAAFTNISTTPSSTQSGQSGNYSLDNNVTLGDSNITVQFRITASGSGSSSTAYGRTVNVTSSTTAGPETVTVTGLTSPCNLSARGSFCSQTASITVPTTVGAYQVRILAEDNQQSGKLNSDFIFVNFTVVAPPCNPVQTSLALTSPACAVLHANSVTLSATLTAGGSGLGGQTIHFKVDGTEVGTGITGSDGTATYNYDPSGLEIGDHALSAVFDPGDGSCDYYGSTATGGKLGISYLFLGYQQPINADGTSIFKGNTIPVKIKITDANGTVISDAAPEVYIWPETATITGTVPENVSSSLNFDHGYVMRYDPTANQYIYNMDLGTNMALGTIANGTNTIQVYLGDGTACAAPHQVSVSVQKKK